MAIVTDIGELAIVFELRYNSNYYFSTGKKNCFTRFLIPTMKSRHSFRFHIKVKFIIIGVNNQTLEYKNV